MTCDEKVGEPVKLFSPEKVLLSPKRVVEAELADPFAAAVTRPCASIVILALVYELAPGPTFFRVVEMAVAPEPVMSPERVID